MYSHIEGITLVPGISVPNFPSQSLREDSKYQSNTTYQQSRTVVFARQTGRLNRRAGFHDFLRKGHKRPAGKTGSVCSDSSRERGKELSQRYQISQSTRKIGTTLKLTFPSGVDEGCLRGRGSILYNTMGLTRQTTRCPFDLRTPLNTIRQAVPH